MIRRLLVAAFEDACNLVAGVVVGAVFWAAKHADPTACNWANVTDDEGERDPRPCKGRNANICVGEGCYGEACRKVGGGVA